MREIKFKVWNGKVMSESFGIGDLEAEVIWAGDPDETIVIYLPILDDSIDIRDPRLIFREYTSLKDKNNKEIYKGDIVRNSFKKVFEVVWSAPSFGLWDGRPGTFQTFFPPYLEIIGNIYENPELKLDQR